MMIGMLVLICIQILSEMSIENFRKSITPVSRAQTIIVKYNTPQNRGKAFLLVEGKSDKEFYSRFFNDSTCNISPMGGCSSLEVVFEILKEKTKIMLELLILAIRDMDFLKLEGIEPPTDMYYTDAHDYEMMCIDKSSVLRDLFEGLAIPYKKEIMNTIYEDLKYLSYIKWYVVHYNLNYHVKDIKVAAKSEAELKDLNWLIGEIQSKTPTLSGLSEDAVVGFIEENKDCERSEITNGHDFCLRLNYLLRQHRIQRSKKNIEDFIASHFSFESFTETNLYKSIVDWEKRHGKKILKREES